MLDDWMIDMSNTMFVLNDNTVTMSYPLNTPNRVGHIYQPENFCDVPFAVHFVILGISADVSVDLSKVCGIVDNMNVEHDRLDVQWHLLIHLRAR